MQCISLAGSNQDIERCLPVILELRPDLIKGEFLSQVMRQEKQSGYKLVFVEEDGGIKAVAGFRISECLAWGKYLYIDDLVTKEASRSKGYGGVLLQWLIQHAKEQSCEQLHLDSGVQRFDAHRFYKEQEMVLSSYHFSIKLGSSKAFNSEHR